MRQRLAAAAAAAAAAGIGAAEVAATGVAGAGVAATGVAGAGIAAAGVAASADAGTEPGFEILVVDNASTDATRAVAERRSDAARDAGASLRIVTETRKGLTRARQRGQREARGDLVAWVDADTEMPAGWLERVLGHFAASSAVVCVSGPYRYLDQTRFQRALVRLYWTLLAMPSYWFTGYLAVGGNFAVRREAVERIGGFDESIEFYGEDTNIARRLSKAGKVVFDLKLEMPTSPRRFAAEGLWRTAYNYVTAFVSEAVLKRPVTERYRDIR